MITGKVSDITAETSFSIVCLYIQYSHRLAGRTDKAVLRTIKPKSVFVIPAGFSSGTVRVIGLVLDHSLYPHFLQFHIYFLTSISGILDHRLRLYPVLIYTCVYKIECRCPVIGGVKDIIIGYILILGGYLDILIRSRLPGIAVFLGMHYAAIRI